ncbi:hypothetical protein [Streptomyces malaysiensis]
MRDLESGPSTIDDAGAAILRAVAILEDRIATLSPYGFDFHGWKSEDGPDLEDWTELDELTVRLRSSRGS